MCESLLCVHCMTYLPIYCSKCVWQYFRSPQMSARICADIRSLLQCLIFSKSKMSAKVRSPKKKTKSEFYTSFCRCPQAYLHRAADVCKKIALAETEKCQQKSAGFDKGTDICGFVADICVHTPTSSMIYANVRGSPHMSAAYARPVADIEGTGFYWKNVSSKSYSHFFSKNISVYAIFNDKSFNDMLTNNIVNFEQLGLVC